MVSSSNYFVVVSVFESYVVHCRFGVDVCIWTKIQWLLFMKTCCEHLDKYSCMVIMIVYVCY
jgi:hypothetical protein